MRRPSAVATSRTEELTEGPVETDSLFTMSDQTGSAPPTSSPVASGGKDQSTVLLPLARLLARQAARQRLHRSRGYGLLQIAIGLLLATLGLAGALLLAPRLGGQW